MLDDYQRLRCRIGYFSIYADLTNLLDTRLEKIPGLPEIPRSIHIGLLFSPR